MVNVSFSLANQRSRLAFALVIACLGAMLSTLAEAQAPSTVSTGSVSDQMQGLVPGVTLVLIDAQGKEQLKGRTDKTGILPLKSVR